MVKHKHSDNDEHDDPTPVATNGGLSGTVKGILATLTVGAIVVTAALFSRVTTVEVKQESMNLNANNISALVIRTTAMEVKQENTNETLREMKQDIKEIKVMVQSSKFPTGNK